MTHFDVFNGDADGICSPLQTRFATSIDSLLITGAKRDIALTEGLAPSIATVCFRIKLKHPAWYLVAIR